MPKGSNDEYKRILSILDENKRKNFVKRIMKPDKYPVINNEDGSVSSHLMGYGEADGRYYVYPTIIQSKRKGDLVRLSDDDAWTYSQETGEYIEFDNEDDAAWFSENYKQYWDAKGK